MGGMYYGKTPVWKNLVSPNLVQFPPTFVKIVVQFFTWFFFFDIKFKIGTFCSKGVTGMGGSSVGDVLGSKHDDPSFNLSG